MKTLLALAVAAPALFSTGIALAQNGSMMNGGMWSTGWMGGYGGLGVPILLLIVVVVLVAWIIKRGGK